LAADGTRADADPFLSGKRRKPQCRRGASSRFSRSSAKGGAKSSVDQAGAQLGRTTMLNMSNLLKGAAVASLLGFGALGATVTPASADTIETRCNGFGDCYRVRCDDFHDDCVRVGYYSSSYSHAGRRWVCDADGDDCHWAYYNDDYYYHHYYRPGVSFGFRF
jgi:hypothetical protein